MPTKWFVKKSWLCLRFSVSFHPKTSDLASSCPAIYSPGKDHIAMQRPARVRWTTTSHAAPHTSAIFPLSARPIFFRPINPDRVSETMLSLAFASRRLSKASTKARGVCHLFWISSAFSPVTPRVHISIFRKMSRNERASDFEHSALKVAKVTW